ncbi:MAG: BatA domain-containing protein [Candidatus Edwardsbacteria bacterium]|nr:BatA domain-containing protein [Candidatus Edwardsbacteria bacterium]
MSFLNPWALWFLPLAALPVLIHLFRRRPAAAIPFPDLRFLRESHAATWRRARLQELLLLALRVLAVAALVLALARPRAGLALPGWLGGREGAVIIVLDDSASMDARDGGGPLFERAKARALEIIDGRAASGRVAVVSAAQGGRIVCGPVDPGRARRLVGRMAPTDLGTDIPAAVAVAAGLAARSGGPTEIAVISDLQRTGFGRRAPLPALPAGARLTLERIAAGRPLRSLVWERVTASALRRRIIAAGRLPGGGTATVRLERNGRTLFSQRVAADADGAFSAGFGWPDLDSLTLGCSGDDLPRDDVFFLPDRARLSVLLVADTSDQDLTGRALAAMADGGIVVERSPAPSDGQLRDADVIVLCPRRVDATLAARLRERLDAGAGLLAMPPASADAGSYNRLLRPLAGWELQSLWRGDPATPAPSLEATPAAARLGLETDARALAAASVSACWRVAARGPAAIRAAGQPALLIDGRRGLWLFGAEPEMNTLVFAPAFLVLLHRVLALLGDDAIGLQVAGRPLRASTGTALADPSGAAVPASADGRHWLPVRRGWYHATGAGASGLIAVNVPAEESDLTPIDSEELRRVTGNAPESDDTASQRPVTSLETAFLLLTLVLLAGEAVLRTPWRQVRTGSPS